MVSAPSEVRVYVLRPPADGQFQPYVVITDPSNNILGHDNQPLGVFVAPVVKAEGEKAYDGTDAYHTTRSPEFLPKGQLAHRTAFKKGNESIDHDVVPMSLCQIVMQSHVMSAARVLEARQKATDVTSEYGAAINAIGARAHAEQAAEQAKLGQAPDYLQILMKELGIKL